MTEPARSLVVEVVASQGATIVDVTAVAGRRGVYRIGEGPRAQVTVAVAGADAEGCWTLVRLDREGPSLRLPPGASGEIEAGGAETALSAEGWIRLSEGTCAIVHVGPLRFEVRTAAADRELKTARWRLRPAIEWPLWLAQAASLVLLALLALLAHRQRGEPPRWDDPELQARLVRYATGLPPRVAPDPPRVTGGEAGPSRRPEAQIVTVATPEVEAPGAPTGPTAAGDRAHDLEDISRQSSFLGLAEFDRILREYTASLDASIRHYAPSAADDAAWAAAGAVPRALAGLGLGETIRGGGGAASAVIDLDLGELMAGLAARRRRGPPGQGRKESAFSRDAVPKDREVPRQDMAWTSSVSQDLIRGVVRRHTPEVRRCFREGAATGKLEVAFTIGAGGKVQAAEVADSTIDNAAVHACVTGAVKSWRFPTIVAAAGEVAVRYPFSAG